MHFHGDLAELDASCDLFAHETARNEGHDFTLARGQECEMLLEVRDRVLMFTTRSVALDRSRDRIEQILVAKWLGQEIDGTGFHGSHRHRNISMSSDKYNRNSNVGLCQLDLEIETAQSGQADIEYEAAWNISALGRENLLG